MARTKKADESEEGDEEEVSSTVAVVENAPPQAVEYRIERHGTISEPMVRHFPRVFGGVCEFCGTQPGTPSYLQYTKCKHYRGMKLQCSYCDRATDPDEVIGSRKVIVVEHPDKPGTLIVCCSATSCTTKHQKRFQVAGE